MGAWVEGSVGQGTGEHRWSPGTELPDLPRSNTDHGPEIMIRASILKGWFSFGATGLLLYLLVAGLLDGLDASHQREIDNYREMQRTHPLSCQR